MDTRPLVSLDADSASLLVAPDLAVRVGARASDAVERLDCRGARIEPGRVNAHTHLYSGLAPLGMPAPEQAPQNFVQILERVWWKLDRALDEASLRASARLYAANALLAGTTTLVDHHESPAFIEGSLDVIAEACEGLGERVFTVYGATERNGGREEARRGLAECARFVRSRPRAPGFVGLHASFTVSDDTVREAGELGRELGAALHVHVAEDGADVEDARRRGYAGPLERLYELGALLPGSILAHGVHLSEEQVRVAQAAGCWLVHNPRSNANNRVGHAHLKGERVALGTDGFPADMPGELAAWERIAREDASSDPPQPARLAAGTRLADEQLRKAGRSTAADLVVLEADDRVRHVVVEGRVVVRDGRLVLGDLEAIRAEAREQAAKVWERMRRL